MAETKKVTVAELLAAMSIQNQRIEALQQMLESQKGTAAKPAKPEPQDPVNLPSRPRVLKADEAKALGLPEGTAVLVLAPKGEAVLRKTATNWRFYDRGTTLLPYDSGLSLMEHKPSGGWLLRWNA